jgi:hypothetical protein
MTWLIAFYIGCSVVLLSGCREKDWVCQFPFLAACVFLGWMGPQIATIYARQEIPQDILSDYLFMSTLCITGIALGAWVARRTATQKVDAGVEKVLGLQRAMTGFLVLGIAGIVGGIAALRWWLNASTSPVSSQPLVAVFILMLAVNLKYGLGLAWMTTFTERTRYAIVVAGLATAVYLVAIVVLGRRAMAADLVFAVLLSFWFVRQPVLPKWFVIGLVFAGVAWVGSAKGIRSLFLGKPGDFADGVLSLGDGGCKNGALVIWDTHLRGAYDYGLKGWDRLLYGHFPGQPLGGQFREVLFPRIEYAPQRIGLFELQRGVSITGPADCYQSFGYFGAFSFAVLGYLMQRCYLAAMGGNLESRLAYIFLVGAALHMITHGLYTFLAALIHFTVFFIPIYYLSRKRLDYGFQTSQPI